MEIEKINQMMNEGKPRNAGSYYLLDFSNTWELEHNLSSLDSAAVNNYVCSNRKMIIKIKDCVKDMHQKLHIDRKESIASADNIKQECFVDRKNGKDYGGMFCNVMSRLLHDDTVDAKRCISSNKNMKLTQSNKMSLFCNVCVKKYSSKNSLKKHQLIHTGDKPFTCDICDNRFSRKDCLKVHKLSHSCKTNVS